VRKDSQGQGIGSILLKNIIETCKQNNKIKYIALDTANPKNVTLYTRVGFNTIAVKEFSNNLTQTVMTYSL
jgi:GNAT superfamily N-acetyltransferase